MGKPDGQTGRPPTRFPSSASIRATALYDEEERDNAEGDSAFYRPAVKKPPATRAFPGNSPFREKKIGAEAFENEDEPFLRANRRVAVRRGLIPRNRWGRLGIAAGAVMLAGGLVWLAAAIHNFAAHDPRFRIDSSENIQIVGNSEVTRGELLSVFGGDMGRNVFFVPLSERRTELDRLPWVESATVMRLLPDQLRVAVVERKPVAFVRNGSDIGLVDHEGVLLNMDPKTMAARHYSFPVVTGIASTDALSTRAARMKIYQKFIAELDSSEEKLSTRLSEVDLSDPEDVRAFVPSQGADLLLHFGDQDFLTRWRNYEQHLAEWKAQYPHLASVDLRYERQVVLEMQKGSAVPARQDAAGRTLDDLKAEASAISPTAARQMAGGRKAGTKARSASASARHTSHFRN